MVFYVIVRSTSLGSGYKLIHSVEKSWLHPSRDQFSTAERKTTITAGMQSRCTRTSSFIHSSNSACVRKTESRTQYRGNCYAEDISLILKIEKLTSVQYKNEEETINIDKAIRNGESFLAIILHTCWEWIRNRNWVTSAKFQIFLKFYAEEL